MAIEEAATLEDIEVEALPSAPVVRSAPVTARNAAEARGEAARLAILTAPILPTLFRLALPTVTVLVAQTAVNIAEAYYVGFLGTDALAGAALVFPIFMLMTMMSNGGFGSGVASSVARAVGAGRHDDANALLFHAIVLAIGLGALFTLAASVLGPLLYRALGGRGGALAAALLYSNYLFAGAVPVWIVNLQAAALRGAGNVKVPALVTLVGAIVMIPMSPLLIFGFGPMPGLGIAGAGLAFGLYYCGAMLFLLRYMASGRAGLSLSIVALRGRLLADILKVGLPTSFVAFLTNLTVILVTGAVGLFGTTALAGYGISSRLDYIMIPLLFGVGTATLTMVGVNVGAGQMARARQIGWGRRHRRPCPCWFDRPCSRGVSARLAASVQPRCRCGGGGRDLPSLRRAGLWRARFRLRGWLCHARRGTRVVAARLLDRPHPDRGRWRLDRGHLARRRHGGAGRHRHGVADRLCRRLRRDHAVGFDLEAGRPVTAIRL